MKIDTGTKPDGELYSPKIRARENRSPMSTRKCFHLLQLASYYLEVMKCCCLVVSVILIRPYRQQWDTSRPSRIDTSEYGERGYVRYLGHLIFSASRSCIRGKPDPSWGNSIWWPYTMYTANSLSALRVAPTLALCVKKMIASTHHFWNKCVYVFTKKSVWKWVRVRWRSRSVHVGVINWNWQPSLNCWQHCQYCSYLGSRQV